VRDYIEGHSLRDELNRDGRGLPIAFVHRVLAALGEAMIFAQEARVWDLGIEPAKVLIPTRSPGLPSDYIVISPAIEHSDYIKDILPEQLTEEMKVYVPPEKLDPDLMTVPDRDRANQYRLGIIGYEMIVGNATFKNNASRRSPDSHWPSIDPHQTRGLPSFLRQAIERMIDPRPSHRFESLKQAVESIAHRDFRVEVARDSFRRALDRDERGFFCAFYARLLEKSPIAEIFRRKGFPTVGNVAQASEDRATRNWEEQFRLLKEAILLLFAYNVLKETQEPTVLTRTAESHSKFVKAEHYDHFREALLDTIVEFDKGKHEHELRDAWQHAVGPGLDYLKKKLQSDRS
jgi:hemoglobin-like flavoprotein